MKKKNDILTLSIIIFCMATCIGFFHLGKIKDRDIDRFCTITKENEEYREKITDSKGEVIYDERYGTEPTVINSDRDTLIIRSGKGDWHSYIFVNTRAEKVSEAFDDISTWNSEFVVYATHKEEAIRIVIQNIYDKNEYYMEICRDYAQVAVPHHVVQQAEFLDEKQVRIEYYDCDNELREEII